MSRKATFSVKNAKSSSSSHNSREASPKYLIETDPNFNKNTYEKFGNYQSDKQYREYAKKIYTEKMIERNGQAQSMQKPQVKALIKEVVLSAEEHHTRKDIISLFDKLGSKKGGYHILELSNHKDEGHFERVGEWKNLAYYPTKDILLKEDGNWYIKSNELMEDPTNDDFDTLADILEFKKMINDHWHVKFTHFNDETGKTARLSKMDVSGEGRLKYVAEHLGLRYAPDEKIPLGQGVKSIKEQHHINRQNQYKLIMEERKSKKHEVELDENDHIWEDLGEKVEVISTLQKKIADLEEKLTQKGKVSVKDLNTLNEEYRQEMISSKEVYTKEDYQALNKFFADAKEKNKSKELDINELEADVATLTASIEKKMVENEDLREKVDILERDLYFSEDHNKALKSEIMDLPTLDELEEQKTLISSLTGKMEDLEVGMNQQKKQKNVAIKLLTDVRAENIKLKKEISYLKQIINKFQEMSVAFQEQFKDFFSMNDEKLVKDTTILIENWNNKDTKTVHNDDLRENISNSSSEEEKTIKNDSNQSKVRKNR